MILINFCVLAMFSVDALRAQEQEAGTDGRSLWDLSARVDELRLSLQQLHQEWQQEQQDLDDQIAVYESLLQQEQARTASLQEQYQVLVAEQAGLLAQQAQEAAAVQAASDLHAWFVPSLEELSHNSLLVLAATDAQQVQAAEGESAAAWRHSLARLDLLERHARGIHLRLREGRMPDGSRRVVEVIALGHAAAWWRALDGEGVGMARASDGLLHLQPEDGPHASAIHRAFRIRGGGMPQPLFLPILPTKGQP